MALVRLCRLLLPRRLFALIVMISTAVERIGCVTFGILWQKLPRVRHGSAQQGPERFLPLVAEKIAIVSRMRSSIDALCHEDTV